MIPPENSTKKNYRVVCLVPSITETLIECGIDVVGRTRFCLHPEENVKNIPVVGGTKQARWKLIEDLKPDLIVIDKEENPKSFLDETTIPFAITHFDTIKSAGEQFRELANQIPSELNQGLLDIAMRYEQLMINPSINIEDCMNSASIPGFVKWLKKPNAEVTKALYLIWYDPWMTVNQETFIRDTFVYLGCNAWFPDFDKKYPEIEVNQYPGNETLLLCSSEPFPFEKKSHVVEELNYPSALIDGEVFSWFGIRNLAFIEKSQVKSIKN